MRVALLCVEPGLLGGSCWFGSFALSWNYESPPHQFGQSLFRQISVAALASHVTRNYADTPIGRETRAEPFLETHALLLAECAGYANVPENLHARGCLIDVLASRARGSRDPHIKFASGNRQ